MKLKVWNWLNKISGGILFSLWIALLVEPWLNSLNNSFHFVESNIYQIYWIIIVVLLGIITGNIIKPSDKDYIKAIKLGVLITVNIALILLLKWPILIYIPISLVLILLSFRYGLYESSNTFLTDFIIGTVILVFNIFLHYNTGLRLNIYTNIILFFAISIFLAFIFNLKNNIDFSEYSLRPKMFISAIFIFIMIVVIPGLILGFTLESTFFEGILSVIKFIFRGFGYILLGIIYPILKILGPLLEFITDVELEPRERQPEEREAPNFQDQMTENMKPEEGAGLDFLSFIPYVLWGILILVLIWLIYRLIKKIFQKRDTEEVKKGYTEERETVFSLEDLQNNFKDFWNSLNVFNRNKRKHREYDQNNPGEVIREIYYKFLLKYNKIVSFNLYFTPYEYLNHLRNQINHNEYYKELTNLYNKVRYGKKVERDDVKKAQEMWKKIKEE